MDENAFVTSAAGVRSPRILYGTAWKKERTAALVAQALELGFRGIDTACQPKHYDEAGVGAGIAEALSRGLHREDLYLQTKFTPVDGQDPARIPYDSAAPLAEQVAQSFEVSLRNLRTTYLDCLVLHSPLADFTQTLQVWRAMERLHESGGVRQLGISNCYSLKYFERLYREASVRPAVLQNRFYAQTGYDRELRQFCRSEQVIYQSFWTLTANPHLLRHERMIKLAVEYARTPAQILFRYLTQQDVIPLTGTTSAQHMREDLAIFDFELSREAQDAITALL